MRRAVFVLFFIAAVAIPLAVLAEDGVTVVSLERSSFPSPDECTVAPRSADAVFAIAGTSSPSGEPTVGSPLEERVAAMAVEFGSPPAEPVDESTTDAAEATIRELYACYNAGDGLEALALVFDEALERVTAEDLRLITSLFPNEPRPRIEREQVGYRLDGPVGLLPDGRLAAPVLTILPGDMVARARSSGSFVRLGTNS